MKLDDLLDADDADPIALDPIYTNALLVFGFVAATYLAMVHPKTGHHVGVITAIRADGSTIQWIGTGSTADEAETEAIDALARWILNQSVPPATP